MRLHTVLVLPLLASVASADLYTEEHCVEKMPDRTFEIHLKYWYSAKGKRVEEKSEVQHSISIFRWDTQMHYVINLRDDTYREETLADLNRRNDEAKKQTAAQMEEFAKQIEADKGKEEADKFRQGLNEPKTYSLEEVGTETVLGHACTKYRLVGGGSSDVFYWATRELDPGDLNLDAQLSIADHFSASEASLLRSNIGVVLQNAMGKEGDFMVQVVEVTKVSTDPIDPSLFELPKGLKRQEQK
ncbi:MAG: DUF4412 domain-containing protein [Planctomycetota bacterium]